MTASVWALAAGRINAKSAYAKNAVNIRYLPFGRSVLEKHLTKLKEAADFLQVTQTQSFLQKTDASENPRKRPE